MAQWQNNLAPGDKYTQADITNGQVFVQKVDGLVQFFVEGGAYSFPDLGAPYVRAGNATSAFFGGAPVWFVKLAPSDAFSLQIGNLPTLIGAEGPFTFNNVNIQRGLLWNQENIVNRGIQANYTSGPLALSLAWSDGFFSNRYSWLTGSATYTFDPANSLVFSAGGSVNSETVSSTATPLYLNNSQMYNVVYTHTSGPWTIVPSLQYTEVPSDATLGTTQSASTFGGALYVTYAFDGGYSLASRVEYISSTGDVGTAANLLYGQGSKAWSFTITPTWQYKVFFVRPEASFVTLSNVTPGSALGTDFNARDQFRAVLEMGVLF